MELRSRIALELAVLVGGLALFVAVMEFPSVRTAVPRPAWKVFLVVLGVNNLLLVTEAIYYVRYRADWLSDPM